MEKIEELLETYNQLKNKGLKIDLSRGKPSKEQLDLSNNLLNAIELNEDFFHEGDLRN